MRRFVTLVSLTLITLAAVPAGASRLEDGLSRELRGAWSVIAVETYSDCAGYYNNNEVHAAGVASKASRRFDAGELAKIDKINLKRARLDLFLSYAEPILASRIDGPFELFDERSCKVQLMVDVPREVVKSGDVRTVLGYLATTVQTYPARDAALSSATYNRRRRAAFPGGYELTLARYEVWKAEQMNAAVAARSAKAQVDAVHVAERIRQDKEYLEGFGEGVAELRSWDEDGCARLVDIRFSSVRDSPSGSDHGKTWKDGYRDGQELVFNIYLAERLGGCFVPMPPGPDEVLR